MHYSYASISCFVIVGLGLSLTGCGAQQDAPVYPVHGQVLVKGKPAEGALVIFYPINAQPIGDEKMVPRPSGLVESDGSFHLTTTEPKDGARPGDYHVTIVWFKETANQTATLGVMGGESRGGGRDLLKGKYARPEKSGLKVTVAKEPNELAPFNLD